MLSKLRLGLVFSATWRRFLVNFPQPQYRLIIKRNAIHAVGILSKRPQADPIMTGLEQKAAKVSRPQYENVA